MFDPYGGCVRGWHERSILFRCRSRPATTLSSRWGPPFPLDSKHGGERNSVPQFLQSPSRHEFLLLNRAFVELACFSIRRSRSKLIPHPNSTSSPGQTSAHSRV